MATEAIIQPNPAIQKRETKENKNVCGKDLPVPFLLNLFNRRVWLNAKLVLYYMGGNLLHCIICSSVSKLLVSDESWSSLVTWWEPYGYVWLFVLGSILIHAILYYGMNCLFLFFHFRGIFKQYQIPRTKGQPFPDATKLRKTIIEGTISHFTSLPVGTFVLWKLIEFRGGTMAGPLPSWWTLVWQLLIALIVLDFVFYWVHRWFHIPYLYQKFHKKHHEYKWTIGFAAEWAHPVEHLLANQSSMAIAMIFMGVHGFTWFVWLAYRLWDTFQGHSGYAFPFYCRQTQFHDFHHTNNVGNYASEFMDTLFGTNKLWALKRRKALVIEMQNRPQGGIVGQSALRMLLNHLSLSNFMIHHSVASLHTQT